MRPVNASWIAAGAATAFMGLVTGSAAAAEVNVSTWAHGAPLQEAVIASQPDLLRMIPAEIKWLPITSGPAALAGMKGGAYNIVNGVGNPPVTTAIAKGIDLKVVWAEFFDNAGVVLDPALAGPEQMAGKTFGTLQGASEDFAFHGWLKSKGLEGKVKIVALERQAMVAAFKTKAIAGGVNSEPALSQMVADGGKVVATVKDISKLGYPALDVVAVDADYAAKNPAVVQGYVCALKAAWDLMTGPSKDEVFRKASAAVGADPAVGTKVGESWPIWNPKDELTQQGLGEPGHLADGAVAQAYFRTGQWLKEQGRLDAPPSMDTIVAHIDIRYAQKALSGGCK
ncbi:MAG TPA: ABC transporter substrate-binding protein [Stellaceae bacterium]|nr:ABC transporter substrate-binding protein [Stellaceae bacterium]